MFLSNLSASNEIFRVLSQVMRELKFVRESEGQEIKLLEFFFFNIGTENTESSIGK